MSKHFSEDKFGEYSLIGSIITVLIYIVGLDFYNFSIRNILKGDRNKNIRINKVFSTFILYLIIYVVLFLILYPIFHTISYVKPYILLIIFLGFTEHLSQEIYRLQIAFKKVLLANSLFFFRTISWVLVLLYKIWFNEPITLQFLLQIWLIANVLVILIVGLYEFNSNYKDLIKSKFDKNWVKKGLKIAMVFFAGTISLKMIEYSSRFILDFFVEKELTGVFIFYANIATLVTVYINTIVISFEMPTLIETTNAKNIKTNLKAFEKLLKQHIVVVIVGILLVIKPILMWQNKPLFEVYLPILFLMLVGVGMMNYSFKEHLHLYILHKDKILLKILVLTNIISLFLTIGLTALFGIYGTAVSFLISGVVLFYFRKKEVGKINIIE